MRKTHWLDCIKWQGRRGATPLPLLLGAGLLLVAGNLCVAEFSEKPVVPSAENILPDDTLAMVTITDCSRFGQFLHQLPQSRFWNDEAMRPFREKFLVKIQDEFLQHLERELDVRFQDYTPLLQGQLTLAVTQNGWHGTDDPALGFVLLLDTKDKSGLLRTNLANIRKKRMESDKSLKNEKILAFDFTTLTVSTNDVPTTLRRLFPPQLELHDINTENQPKTSSRPNCWTFGQVGSLLVVGNSMALVEKVVIRASGGAGPALSEVGSFASIYQSSLQDTPLHGWLSVKSFVDIQARRQLDRTEPESPDPFSIVNSDKLLTATGLNGLKALAFSLQNSDGGTLFQAFLNAPDSERQGILKVLATESKPSSPPTFVPGDTVKFQRWRVDGQKAWAALERMLTDVSPQWLNAINFLLNAANSAVAQREPGFDLRKNLIGNLGDDLIIYEKGPRNNGGDLSSPPTMFLVASPNAFLFAVAVKDLFGFNQSGESTEREFLGRKIFSVPLPALPLLATEPGKSSGPKPLNFAASGGYVAFSSDISTLEEYLRSSENQGKALVETPGLGEASQKVLTPGTGCFGFENQVESMRIMFDGLKRDPIAVGKASQLVALVTALGAVSTGKDVVDWMDFSLLPPFDRVAKYFTFTIFAGDASVDAIKYSFYTPWPAFGGASASNH